jgi:3-deoxy-D-manno-octulosonate 8-phosphate phosphatase (KDO 8-P phosphatase)
VNPGINSSPVLDQIGELLAAVKLVAFDFDGVFTDNTVYVNQEGIEAVRCWRGDGIGLSRLRSIGVHTIILSTEVNPVVSVRARKLKTECRQGLEDKAEAIRDVCRSLGIPTGQAAFVGNDVNDIPALRVVGLPIAVGDAYPEILPHVLYRTSSNGGMGAVREVCDLIYFARKGSSENRGAYG